jgi:mono/diheme cytochrome c family protein
MQKLSDAELFRVIKGGGSSANRSADMPAYSEAMEDDEIQDLVAFVRSLCAR